MKEKLSKEELVALKVKLLILGIKYRVIGGAFGVSRAYVCQILNGVVFDARIIDHIRKIPFPKEYRKILSKIQKLKEAA